MTDYGLRDMPCQIICLNGRVAPTAAPQCGSADARRLAGERTRRQLLHTAQEMIAERGEDAVRLRDLTTRAATNIGAVHYHFGSMRTLLAAATTDAVERIVDAQIRELDALPGRATLHDISAAYLRPMIAMLAGPSSSERAYVRVLARFTTDPPAALQAWADDVTARAHHALIPRLRDVLPGLTDDTLRFRVICAGGVLVLLSAVALQPHIAGRTPQELEDLLTPVVAGALAGG